MISVVDVSPGTQVFVTRQDGKGQSEVNYIFWASDDVKPNQVVEEGLTTLNGSSRSISPVSRDETAAEAPPTPPSNCREPTILTGLYGGKESGELDVWDMMRGSRREKLSYNENPISCLDVAGGVGIAAGCDNGTVVLWLLKKRKAINDF